LSLDAPWHPIKPHPRAVSGELELKIPVAVVAPPHPAEDENLPQVVRKKL
jgi:hypothetical protein